MKLLSVIGTRPEAVKLAPVLLALDGEPGIVSQVCVTAQHRDLLDPVLDFFCIHPNFDLDVMRHAQGLNRLAAQLIERLDPILAGARPDRVIVQGDTSTAFAAALAAFHLGIPVAHVEAGLRTYCPAAPFPEEANRRAIALIADLHFAPTAAAGANLAAERVCGAVHVTGNSGIDALRLVLGQIGPSPPADPAKRLILVTCHRRESFGAPFAAICAALERLAARPDVDVLFPRHPNPGLGAPPPHARALPPLGLPDFVRLMRRADLILTDSGGVQEEAAALGTPVVILREATERPESGAILAGADPDRIAAAADAWLEGTLPPPAPSHVYGDGFAAQRIVDGLLGRPVDEFTPNRLAPAAWSARTS
jgi:UDP-N-acetylglucosamine 2-epimerase (non-hydrolysing)